MAAVCSQLLSSVRVTTSSSAPVICHRTRECKPATCGFSMDRKIAIMKVLRVPTPVLGLIAGVAAASQVSAGLTSPPTVWQWVCLAVATLTAGFFGAWSLASTSGELSSGTQQSQKNCMCSCTTGYVVQGASGRSARKPWQLSRIRPTLSRVPTFSSGGDRDQVGGIRAVS